MSRRTVNIRDNRHNMDRLRRDVRATKKRNVVVGFTHAVDGKVIKYATYNEFGTDVIPSRPFMRYYYDNNIEKIGRFAERQFLAYLLQESHSLEQTLSAIGLYVQNGIKGSIRSAVQWAIPNAPYTVYLKLMKNRGAVERYITPDGHKRVRLYTHEEHSKVSRTLAFTGRSGTKPLIDHGIMINTVTFDLRAS